VAIRLDHTALGSGKEGCLESVRNQLEVLANLGKKLARPHLNQWLGIVVHSCDPSYTGIINKRIRPRLGLGKNGLGCGSHGKFKALN
jgi:hypothetical protein